MVPLRNPIETHEEYKQRTCNDTYYFPENCIPFTKADYANLFRAKPSRIYASISAVGRIWHPHIVKMDSAAGPNLIDITLLKPEWCDHIQPCQHPRYTGAKGPSIRFHGVILFYLELADIRT